MKIGFLTPEFPHSSTGSSGGIGTSILNLSKGLIELGHQVSIFVYGQSMDEKLTVDGLTIYRIKNIKVKGLSRFLTQKKIESLINLLYKKKELDIVEAPDWTGISSFIKPKCPIVIRLNGSDTYFCSLDNRPVKSINKYHEKKALKNADAIISVSQYTADVTKKLFNLKREIEIIPNSIDITNFSNTTSKICNETILYFGTLIRKKGLLELPYIFNEVFKINNSAKLILIGKDSGDVLTGNRSTWELMKPLFDVKSIENVFYHGSVPYSQIKEQIEDAAVCVFPTFAEALPVSWIEAMAMNKAIVASNIGWADEVIDDEINGYLVNPKNHIEYAQKICKLIDNKELRNLFGENARKKVESKFSIEIVAKQSANFYKKILQSKL